MRTRGLRPLALMLVVPLTASAQTQAPTVAVLEFSAASITLEDASAIGRGLADMFMTELSSRPTVKLIERQEIDDLVEKRKLVLSGRVTDETAIEIGQLLGANYLVTGQVLMQNDLARIDIRMLDVESGEIYRSKKLTGKRAEFLALVEQLADDFTTGLKLPERRILAEVEVPVGAMLAFSRGLDYEKRGKAAEARAMFARAVELHPEHTEAKSALERVSSKGGR